MRNGRSKRRTRPGNTKQTRYRTVSVSIDKQGEGFQPGRKPASPHRHRTPSRIPNAHQSNGTGPDGRTKSRSEGNDMSAFYGTLKGTRGEATRCGSKASGIVTHAASWAGAVRAYVYLGMDGKTDMARVELVPWHGRGVNQLLYDGPVSGAPAFDPSVTTPVPSRADMGLR